MFHRLTVNKFDGHVMDTVTRDPCSLVRLQATIMLAIKNQNISSEFREISSVIQSGTLPTKQSSVPEEDVCMDVAERLLKVVVHLC